MKAIKIFLVMVLLFGLIIFSLIALVTGWYIPDMSDGERSDSLVLMLVYVTAILGLLFGIIKVRRWRV